MINIKEEMRVQWEAWDGTIMEGNIIKPVKDRPQSVLLRLDNGDISVAGINELTIVEKE